MKPPDRPAPGRTDRILGVMGGMLRACALPGQEWVRKGDHGGLGGLFKGLQDGCTPQLNLPASKNSAGQSQESKSSIKKTIGTFRVNCFLHPSLGDPFITKWILTGGRRGGGRRGGGRSRPGLEGGFLTIIVPAAPQEKPPRARSGRTRVYRYGEGSEGSERGART